MQLAEDRRRRQLVGFLSSHALQHKRAGFDVVQWMLTVCTPTSFEGCVEQPNDEMNVSMALVAGWVWAPRRRRAS